MCMHACMHETSRHVTGMHGCVVFIPCMQALLQIPRWRHTHKACACAMTPFFDRAIEHGVQARANDKWEPEDGVQ